MCSVLPVFLALDDAVQAEADAHLPAASVSSLQLPAALLSRTEGAPQPLLERINDFLQAERLLLRQRRDESSAAQELNAGPSVGMFAQQSLCIVGRMKVMGTQIIPRMCPFMLSCLQVNGVGSPVLTCLLQNCAQP